MIRITDKNRSLVFLAGTLLMGVLVILTLVFLENNDVEGNEMINDSADSNFKDLERRIDDLKNQNFDPTSYNTFASEIDESFRQDLITSSAKTNLVTKLNSTYSDLVYIQCEFFLTGSKGNSNDVTIWLNQLENLTSRNAKISYYRNQIKWYNYYTINLPNKVSVFVSSGVENYTDEKHLSLIDEVKKMPNIDVKYRNSSKLNRVKQNLISELQNFNEQAYTQ